MYTTMAKKYKRSKSWQSLFFTKKMLTAVVLGMLMLSTSVIVAQISKNQDIRQQAEENNQQQVAVTNSAPSKGALTNATCAVISGWSCDEDDYTVPLDVLIYDGNVGYGTQIGTVKADIADAVIAAECGGNAAHAFSFSVPDTLKDGKAHQIYAYGMNTPPSYEGNTQLIGSPKRLVCTQ